MDHVYTIVLISVQIPGSSQDTLYAGVRRPLAMPLISIETQPICRLACASSGTSIPFPECRGEIIPTAGDNLSAVKIKIENTGPGALYSLSLLREDNMLLEEEDSSDKYKYSVTEDALKVNDKEVLLPGDAPLILQDFVDCRDSVRYVYKTITKSSSSIARGGTISLFHQDINVHAQPFMKSLYGLSSLQTPRGVCMAPDPDASGVMKSTSGECPNKYTPGQSCGDSGHCHYSHIEPRRSIHFKSFLLTVEEKEEVRESTSITIRYVSPH